MAKTVRLSSKHQVTIPRALCRKLGIESGQELLIEEELGRVVLRPRPKSYSDALRGLGKALWANLDPLEYIRRERAAWERRPSKPS